MIRDRHYSDEVIEAAREIVRAALHAADNANHAGEMAVLKMAAALTRPEYEDRQ